MSFNLTLVTPSYAICVTDRRLTDLRTGKIVTERSNKLTNFTCRDAVGAITYNGVGRDIDGDTPSDWLSAISGANAMTLDQFADAIKSDVERRLAALAASHGPIRHSFVIAGYKRGRPFILLISNYEFFDAENLPEPSPEFQITGQQLRMPITSRRPYVLLGTGANNLRTSRIKRLVVNRLQAGASPSQLRKQMIKMVRDTSYTQGRKGTVGTSVQTSVFGPSGAFQVGSHIPGGSSLIELPNFMGHGVMFKDIFVDVSGNGKMPRYSPIKRKAVIAEPKCASCGSPIPEGYRQCGVCDTQL